jgi:acyl-CoA thioesterase-1
MAWLIYLFGSGLAFFLGAAIIVGSLAGFCRIHGGWRAKALSILAFAGLVFVALSAAPLSYWVYGVAGLITLVWLALERRQKPRPAPTTDSPADPASPRRSARLLTALRTAVATIWIGMILLEAPYHFLPTVPALGNPTVFVLGDSVTAGSTSAERDRWPERLPKVTNSRNLAEMGATARSAMKQAEQLPPEGGLVLIEIGGNDLLGTTSPADFDRDLEALLERVCFPGRTVLMFELPLPPLMNEYGRAQRRLAARYEVKLIPKRVLMSVLADEGATLDSIHLSSAGHQRLADKVWAILESAYRRE